MGLEVEEFMPYKYEKDVMSMTDADIISELLETNAHMSSIMNSRLNNTRNIRRLWAIEEHKKAVEALVNINDPAIAADILKQINRAENMHALTLEMCAKLLPLLFDLLRSKFEE